LKAKPGPRWWRTWPVRLPFCGAPAPTKLESVFCSSSSSPPRFHFQLAGRRLAGESSSSLASAAHAAMSPGAPQEDVLGEGESAQDQVLQPQQEREEAGDQEEGDGVEEEEEAPTHLPFAPSSEVLFPLLLRRCCYGGEGVGSGAGLLEISVWRCSADAYSPCDDLQLLDDTTTVDPSYTISLIRQLLPQGSNVEKEFSAKQGAPEEKGVNSDNGESAQSEDKDPWEECGCILWDLAASKPQAELMMNNLVLEVLLANLHVTQSPRVKVKWHLPCTLAPNGSIFGGHILKILFIGFLLSLQEICIGIMGNLACHESLVNAISVQNGLIATVVDQLFLDDSACLSETFRSGFHDLASKCELEQEFFIKTLLPDEILSRVLWIVGNTLNSTLLEKSIDFLSTVIDNQDVTAILLQPLIKVGLVDHVISLLASEIEKLSDESKFDRSASLDLILPFVEELSATDSCLEVMSSSDQLIQVLDKIIKLPDKFEVSSYCASVVIILANLLADGKHIVPSLSHDLPFMGGLFDILPLVCDDNQARNALWCILARLLPQAQDIDMNSSSLEHLVSLLLGKFTLIKDDLESHRVELSAEDAYLKHGVSASVSFLKSCELVMRGCLSVGSLLSPDVIVEGNSAVQ
ncbi:hypothetical protein BAE44_0008363, partial [Dichanthelium oligosanthes]